MDAIRVVVVALWNALMSDYLAAHWVKWIRTLYAKYPFTSMDSREALEYGKNSTGGGDDWFYRYLPLYRLLLQAGQCVAGFPEQGDLDLAHIDGEFVWAHGLVRYLSGADGDGNTRDIFDVVLEVLCIPVVSEFPDNKDFFLRIMICELFEWVNNVNTYVRFSPASSDIMVSWERNGTEHSFNHFTARQTYLSIIETCLVLDAEGYWVERGFTVVLVDPTDIEMEEEAD